MNEYVSANESTQNGVKRSTPSDSTSQLGLLCFFIFFFFYSFSLFSLSYLFFFSKLIFLVHLVHECKRVRDTLP